MSLLNIFKKKKSVEEVKVESKPIVELKPEAVKSRIEELSKSSKEEKVEKKHEPQKDGTKPVDFETWYNSLSPDDRRRIDDKLKKLKLKMGTPVICVKCGMPGGKIDGRGYTLKKVDKEHYIHVGSCPEK